jgi:hypothetical protein
VARLERREDEEFFFFVFFFRLEVLPLLLVSK